MKRKPFTPKEREREKTKHLNLNKKETLFFQNYIFTNFMKKHVDLHAE